MRPNLQSLPRRPNGVLGPSYPAPTCGLHRSACRRPAGLVLLGHSRYALASRKSSARGMAGAENIASHAAFDRDRGPP